MNICRAKVFNFYEGMSISSWAESLMEYIFTFVIGHFCPLPTAETEFLESHVG